MLKLREIFSFGNISELPLRDFLDDEEASEMFVSHSQDEPAESDIVQKSVDDDTPMIIVELTLEIKALTDSLFNILSTVENAMKSMILSQMQNPALTEDAMILSKNESEISLAQIEPGPVKDLLFLDLELIAAMQQSLKDTKYAKYIEHRSPAFDAKKFLEELSEQKSQIKYWTSKLEGQDQGTTKETNTAVALHLARIARVFGK